MDHTAVLDIIDKTLDPVGNQALVVDTDKIHRSFGNKCWRRQMESSSGKPGQILDFFVQNKCYDCNNCCNKYNNYYNYNNYYQCDHHHLNIVMCFRVLYFLLSSLLCICIVTSCICVLMLTL